ncbi:MAG: isocitrate dehydrogenase (NAD(+)) [bacterium]|nr:isocitrate dehydrogenase (NAD(+)) [bacterium]
MRESQSRKTITLIKGDGIGPEVADAVVKIIAAAGVAIGWDVAPAGANAFEKCGTVLPEYTVDSVKKNKVALKGPVGTPIGEGFKSISVALRKRLELYANLRPVKSLPKINSRYQNIDLIIVRENTEGLYSGIEHEVVPGVVESLKIITEKASTRIAEFAFQYARNNNRKKVTAVHKANIMKLSDGLFLQCSRKVAEKYPDIEYDEKIVDNACMQLILNPYQFDVMVLENLYGDIISDLCAGLVGGLGTAPGANIGNEYAIFEAVHGSAPDIAGKNLANPIALLRSAILMLEYIGEQPAATRIQRAIEKVLEKGKVLTRDLGGTATTTEITGAIIAEL